jgi:hypothetical protein
MPPYPQITANRREASRQEGERLAGEAIGFAGQRGIPFEDVKAMVLSLTSAVLGVMNNMGQPWWPCCPEEQAEATETLFARVQSCREAGNELLRFATYHGQQPPVQYLDRSEQVPSTWEELTKWFQARLARLAGQSEPPPSHAHAESEPAEGAALPDDQTGEGKAPAGSSGSMGRSMPDTADPSPEEILSADKADLEQRKEQETKEGEQLRRRNELNASWNNVRHCTPATVEHELGHQPSDEEFAVAMGRNLAALASELRLKRDLLARSLEDITAGPGDRGKAYALAVLRAAGNTGPEAAAKLLLDLRGQSDELTSRVFEWLRRDLRAEIMGQTRIHVKGADRPSAWVPEDPFGAPAGPFAREAVMSLAQAITELLKLFPDDEQPAPLSGERMARFHALDRAVAEEVDRRKLGAYLLRPEQPEHHFLGLTHLPGYGAGTPEFRPAADKLLEWKRSLLAINVLVPDSPAEPAPPASGTAEAKANPLPPNSGLPLPARYDFLNRCSDLGPGPAAELVALSRRWQELVEEYPNLHDEGVLARIGTPPGVPERVYGEFQKILADLHAFGERNGCIPVPALDLATAHFRSITSTEQLLAFCKEKKAELAPSTERREVAAVLHLDLLIEVWAVMDRLGTVVPPRPPLLRADRNEALVACLRDEKGKCPHPEDVLAAYDTAIAWCDRQIEEGRTKQKGQRKRARRESKARPGRPADTDPKKDEKIYDAWKSGHYKTYEDLARDLGKTKYQIETAVDRHRKRLERDGG